ASAKNPGGGFLNGANAQEESLCRASSLYASIVSQTEYYTANKECGTCLYTNHIIYSPDVVVFRNNFGELLEVPFGVSVITSPAVNAGVVQSREPHNISQIEPTMKTRIESVLAVAAQHKHTTLVLGAWGCGVFQNNPTTVALLFNESIQNEFKGVFNKIVFAVYDKSKSKNTLTAFRKVFNT
ncbi:MAG: TIGR02452 family protein, partial [Candidatus Kapabacteria bacterium]|nr:TIGR02452 family protein [Candidatus Kapabacteria bacterium]